MSESMRMQSQLAADLEVYRAKGELIALRAENERLREAVVWALGYTDFRAREHGEGPYWWRVELRLRSKLTGEQIDATLAALQPERGKP